MIELIGQMDDILVVLNCEEKGLWLRSVTITNISKDKVFRNEITLYGSKTGSPGKFKTTTEE